MSAYLRELVVVLNVEPYREHDAWISAYGKTTGKINAIARGVRKVTAKQIGHLEPLTCAEIMLAKGKAYDHIAVARSQGPILQSRHRLGALAVLRAFVDVVDRLTQPGVSDPAIYAFIMEVFRTWEQVDQEPSFHRGEYALMAAIIRLLDLLGIAPPMNECALCRTDLTGGAWMLPRQGVLACDACLASRRGEFPQAYPIDVNARKLLAWMANASYQKALQVAVPKSTLSEVSKVVLDCLHHAPMQGTYRGLEYLRVLY